MYNLTVILNEYLIFWGKEFCKYKRSNDNDVIAIFSVDAFGVAIHHYYYISEFHTGKGAEIL